MYVCVVNTNLENLSIPLIQVSITIYANLNVKVDQTSTCCAKFHIVSTYKLHIYLHSSDTLNNNLCVY